MEFRILGPLEVLDNGRSLALGGSRQRALLAALIVRANEVVATERLLDEIWGEEPPASGARLVQVYVSQLRKVLGGGVILTRAPGYVLRASREEVDLHRFERLVVQSRSAEPAAASSLLGEALALWRGEPLADFSYESFAQVEISRLQELRLSALEARIEADLQLGRHAEVAGELDALVAQNPLREQLRAQLMVALYRSGRQPEALAAYQDVVRVLREELGLEPGRSLRELHQAILKQDGALDPPTHFEASTEETAAIPAAVASPDGGLPDREVRKPITAFFASLAIVSMRGAGVDPEALRQVTARTLGVVEAAIERHGGTVDSVAGEALAAVFGLPSVHEDDALRAARAAIQTRAELIALGEELAVERALEIDFRIGISTGEVVTGGGAGVLLRATGEPLTRSSSLAREAQPAEILCDEPTWRLVRDLVIAERVGQAYRLADVPDAVATPARRLESPIVGRDRERRRLQDAYEQAVGDRSCQLFTVLGLAGVGKSRLVHEFLGDVTDRARVARGRCLPYGQGITYWPLLEAVKEAVGVEDQDAPEAALAKLLSSLGEDPAAERLAQHVAETIGLADAAAGAEEGFPALRELFERLAQTQPLVVVFDDIHWAEAKFLDLVEYVADWSRDAPIMLVCLARPELLELRPGWGGGKLNATATLLEPLSGEECSELVQNLVGPTQFVSEVGAKIVDAADGNPLFVEEMLLMLIDEGLLVRENGGWSAVGDVGEVHVPPTIQALLAARLDQLAADERSVIERAAVVGKVFQAEAIAELAGDALRPRVTEALGALVRKELIRPERSSLGGSMYRFRHLLIRDAAYDSIPKETRAELHERFGRWLERTAGERAIEYEEVLGYHLEQAYHYRAELGSVDDAARLLARGAAERFARAGRRAFVRSDAPAGVNLILRAVALLPPDDPERVELVPNVRVIQGMSGDLGWADRVLTEGIEAAATTGDRSLAANALVQRAFLRLFTETDVAAEELIDVAQRAILVFEELGDELGLARAWRLTAQAHYLGRRGGACADSSEQALVHARRARDRFEEQEILEWLVIALVLGPTPAAEAADRCRLFLAETSGAPLLQAQILASLGLLEAMLGHEREADESLRQARAIMNERDEWIWIVSLWHSLVSAWKDDPVAAEQELRPAYEALKKIGEKSHFSSVCHELSNAVYLQGRYAEAEEFTRECEEASRSNDVNSQIMWRSLRAKAIARQGELEHAEALAREAVAFAAASDFHLAHADALTDMAEVLALAGETAAAAEAIETAIRFHELKGNVLGGAKACARLEQLST